MTPTISGYTTTYNCEEMGYPYLECIDSLLKFCDEVVVADAGSTDGTEVALLQLARKEERVRVVVQEVDFSHPRWAIHLTGDLKARARRECMGDYCWQIDTDEIVPDYDIPRIRPLVSQLVPVLNEKPLMYLPMVEFWGSFDKVRADFFSVKLRLSRNDQNITHGIPVDLRLTDESGHEYPKPFDSDGCDYIWAESGKTVEDILYIDAKGFSESLEAHQAAFEQVLERLPCVLHVSWLNLERKIRQYRDFWRGFHESKYNLKRPDSAVENVMFDKPWSEVTDKDIAEKASELAERGPRKFHIKGNSPGDGRWIPYNRPVPEALVRWQYRS